MQTQQETRRNGTTSWSCARSLAVRQRSRAAIAAALVAAVAAVAGCGSSTSGAASGATGGSITVGIAQEPPYSSLTPSGEVTGVGPDVTRAALSQQGITKIVGKVATYGELIPGLQAKRWSMISGTLTLSTSRCKAVRFSYPITVGTDAFSHLTTFAAPTTFKAAVQLAKEGKIKIGVAGSGDNYSRAVAAGVTPVVFPTVLAADQGMEAGRVQLVFDDRTGLQAEDKVFNSKITVTPSLPDIPATFSSVAFPKNNPQFANKFDAAVKKLKASGEFAKILKKWGFSIPAQYANVTGDQACKLTEQAGN